MRWPVAKLGLEGQVPVDFISHGVAVSDDLAAVAGGVDAEGRALHWKTVVMQAKQQCARVFEIYEQFPVPVGKEAQVCCTAV